MKIREILNSKKKEKQNPSKAPKEVVGKNKFNGNYDASKFKKVAKDTKDKEAE